MAVVGETTPSIALATRGSSNRYASISQAIETSSGSRVRRDGAIAMSSKPYARRPVLPIPISTSAIEDLIHELKSDYTIVIVTHNMQQAARVSEETGFFNLAGAGKPGQLVEMNPTSKIFSNPDDERTEQYVTGRFG